MVWLCKTKIWWKSGFIVYIKTDDIYKGISEDAKVGFDTYNYDLGRPLSKAK